MEIKLSFCNNLDNAEIKLTKSKLNIKLAPNGTGKSTLAKAIQYSLENNGKSLIELMPFKLKETNPEGIAPKVEVTGNIRSIMCFNEDYVNQIVFQPDELVSNSFEIFIKNEKYTQLMTEVENTIIKIRNLFINNSELEQLILNLKTLSSAFKLTKSGISKSSAGMKGLSGGNKIEYILPELESFSEFIKSDINISWIDWHVKGYAFLEIVDNCPFCTSDTSGEKEKIRKIGETYNKGLVKSLVDLINVVQNLGDYFSDDARSKLHSIVNLKGSPQKEHEEFLVNIKTQIDTFIEKLERLRTLSGFEFKQGDLIAEKLPLYKLDLEFFPALESIKTQQEIAPINLSIDELVEEAGLLQGKINKLRNEMQKLIVKHQNDINSFLAYAGYKYKVELTGNEEKPKLKLLHVDYKQHLSGGGQHLSFGERNAFSIILFMYECLSKKPDLIVLDDPISSFDKTKKYAILEMLFRRDKKVCLKGKTVLMLTHDVEPIIDTIKSVAPQFHNQISATYLKYANGTIAEIPIRKNDIKTFPKVCKDIVLSDKDEIVKLIYLRRYYEITNDEGDAYQVLSNLLKKRTIAIDKRKPVESNGEHPQMEEDKFQQGCVEIKTHLEDFNYKIVLNRISDGELLRLLYTTCQNGYEKLQIFRLCKRKVNNSVIQKFINETYHVENEFICQLSPDKFDMIPEYVIKECDQYMV